jgi:uncharacterized oxidoreductase
MNFENSTVLITGGGSGIGRALAHRFNDHGCTVIVAGRRAQALDEAMAGRARMAAYLLDVADGASIKSFVARVTQAHPRLNVLVNCAGIMRFEDLSMQSDLTDAEQIIVTNVLGPMRLTNALLPHLKAQRDAAIVNVSSGLAFVPLPAAPTYSASKAALHSYTVSLRARLAGKVEVIEVVPPAVRTELTPGQSTQEEYMPLDAFIDETMALLLRQPTPDEVLVERVKFLRNAEVEGRFPAALAALLHVHA